MVEAGTNLGIGSVYVKTGIEPTQPPLPPPPKLLGPFETLIKFSGMDCKRLKIDRIRSASGVISAFFAMLILVVIMFEVFTLMSIEEKPFSVGWSESTVFGFMAVQSFISAICIMLWTKDNFIAQFEDTLARIRTFRLSTSQTIDNYTNFHRKAASMVAVIFIVNLTTSFYTSLSNRHAIRDNSTFYSESPLFYVAPFIDFIGCIATSLALITYVTINTALNREIKHFNKELTNSARFQQLTLPQVLNNYSKRHSDIIQLIRFSNENLSKYAGIVPFFTMTSLVNALYILGVFKSTIPTIVFVLLQGWALISVAMTVAIFLPAAKIQDNIKDTAEILMHDDVLQTCGDDQMHHTYRVTLDRCIHSNSKIAFMNSFSIDSLNFNRVMFLVPNIAAAMIIVFKAF